MVTSDFRPEVEIQPFRACAMHPATMNSSFIVDVAMGQIPRSTERISSAQYKSLHVLRSNIDRSNKREVKERTEV